MLCKELIGQPKILTSRKFYGRYWHSLTAHAAKQSRIISGKSAYTEEEERQFNTLQGVTKLTNRRPGDIITPTLVRLQAEQNMMGTRQGNAMKAHESQISKYYKALPPFPNMVIPHRYILRKSREYQAHLESISDFLVCGEGVWWRHILEGVEFLDGPDEPNVRPEGPVLHHFRSSNLKLEDKHLQQCWKKCLDEEEIKIPHTVIRVFGNDGQCTKVIHNNFLDDNNDIGEETSEGDKGAADIQEQHSTEDQQYETEDQENENEELEESIELIEEDSSVDCWTADEEPITSICNDDQPACPTQFVFTADEPQSHTLVNTVMQNSAPTDHATLPQASQQKAPKQIVTKLCKNIAKVLGETDDVHQLDKARDEVKYHPKNNFYETKYQNLLALMQTKILAQHTALKEQHNNWEKEYCLSHDCHEPDLSDVKQDKNQYSIYRKLLLCKELLSHWNITAHL